jgi:hypothetical protein
MAKELRLRGGTTAQHSTFTGAEREVTIDTTKDTLVVHDGVTVGGKPLAIKAEVDTAINLKQNAATAVTKDSSTGSARIPSGTTAQRTATPTFGDQRGNSDLTAMEWWNGLAWVPMGGGATGGGTDNVFIEAEYTITSNYTVPAGKSAILVGDANGNITINNGVTISFENTNSRLVVL